MDFLPALLLLDTVTHGQWQCQGTAKSLSNANSMSHIKSLITIITKLFRFQIRDTNIMKLLKVAREQSLVII